MLTRDGCDFGYCCRERMSIVVSNLASAGALVYTNDFAKRRARPHSILPNGATTGEIDLQVGSSTDGGADHDYARQQ